MPIQVKCENGHAMAVPDKYRGKKVRCPKCQAIIAVGAGQETIKEQVSAKPPPLSANRARADEEKPRSQRRPADDEDDDFVDDDEPPRARKKRDDEADFVDDEDDRPRSKKRRDDEDDFVDDDEPPRSRRRRDDDHDYDDEDDRPRSRRRRDEEGDFDDDDRPRSRRRRDDDDYDYDDEDDRPRSRRGRDEEDDWDDDDFDLKRDKKKKGSKRAQVRSTSVGLMLYHCRFLCLAVAQAVLIGCMLLIVIAGLARSETLAMIAGFVALIGLVALFLVAPILGLIGGIFCLRSPPKARAFGLGIAALCLDAGILLSDVLYVVTVGAAIGNPFRAPDVLGMMLIVLLLLVACWIGAFVVIMIMMRNIARYLKDYGAGDQAISAMIFYLSVTIGGGIALVILAIILKNAGLVGVIIVQLLGLGLNVLSTIILFGIAFLIRNIRSNT